MRHPVRKREPKPTMIRKPRKSMSMDELEARLCRIFREHEARHASAKDTGDDDLMIKHGNICIGLAPQIRGAHEVNDQESRIARLESQVGTTMRKVG